MTAVPGRRGVSLFAGVVATAVAACARPNPPLAGVPVQTNAEKRGERVFFAECEQCHPQGGAGVGPAIDRKPVALASVRIVVREGHGQMPSFSPYDLSEPDLQDLLSYLDAMRRTRTK